MAAVSSGAVLESHCPIGSLPPGIADRVCAELRTPDITSLRLVSKFWMNVATPWLLPQVHLVFKADSFQRLVDISKHPVISQYVTSLFYEPDTLWRYHSQEEWQENLSESRDIPLQDYPAVPQPGASERDQRVYQRELARLVNPAKRRHRRKYLRQAYIEYLRLYDEQDGLRRDQYGAAAILDAMTRFPKLSGICMSLGRGIVDRSDYVYQAYAAALQKPHGDYGHIEPSGVAQMRSLLLGAAHAQLQLTRLELGHIN